MEKVWQFFSSPANLAFITPPYLDFKILTKLNNDEIYEGMLIDYTVKPLFGIPLHWQTQISRVKKPELFADRQLKGPFRLWEHSHSFIPVNNAVLMKDEVTYQLPLGYVGKLAHALAVRKKIENIFSYRAHALKNQHKIFETNINMLLNEHKL